MRCLLLALVLVTACGEAKPANAPDDLDAPAPSGPCGGTSPAPGYQCLKDCGPSAAYRWMSPEDVEKRHCNEHSQ
jgi:hypothetical protein